MASRPAARLVAYHDIPFSTPLVLLPILRNGKLWRYETVKYIAVKR